MSHSQDCACYQALYMTYIHFDQSYLLAELKVADDLRQVSCMQLLGPGCCLLQGRHAGESAMQPLLYLPLLLPDAAYQSSMFLCQPTVRLFVLEFLPLQGPDSLAVVSSLPFSLKCPVLAFSQQVMKVVISGSPRTFGSLHAYTLVTGQLTAIEHSREKGGVVTQARLGMQYSSAFASTNALSMQI